MNLSDLRGWRLGALGLWLGFLAAPAQAQAPPLETITFEQLREVIDRSEAQVKIVNFWATWCAPCLEEFPYFTQLGKDLADQGVEVLFVSMDFPDEQAAVEAFLAEQGWTNRSFLRVGKDHEFIAAVHDGWSGVLPATFLYRRDGSLADFWQGAPVGYEELRARVMDTLEP